MVLYSNCFSLDGKVAVVAGAAGLIGAEVSSAMACSGATVILADINKVTGAALAAKLDDAEFYKLNISEEASVKILIKAVHHKYGRIDAWINCAYPRTADWADKFEDTRLASWKKNLDLQLGSCFISCRAAAGYMLKQKSGSIVNFASIYGIKAPDFSVYEGTKMTMPAAYSAIKGGVISFTRYLAAYYGKYNIRVNCISPGGVLNGQPDSFVKKYCRKTPLARMALPGDIAAAAVYLASDASGYVTGHNLVVDGGWSIA